MTRLWLAFPVAMILAGCPSERRPGGYEAKPVAPGPASADVPIPAGSPTGGPSPASIRGEADAGR